MKSLDALYEEIQGSDELKKEFVTAYKEGSIEDFLKKNDCDASAEDVKDYLDGLKESAVSDDDLDKVSGGCGSGSSESCLCSMDCYPTMGAGNGKLGVCD